MFCPKCGNKIAKNGDICSNCGRKLQLNFINGCDANKLELSAHQNGKHTPEMQEKRNNNVPNSPENSFYNKYNSQKY